MSSYLERLWEELIPQGSTTQFSVPSRTASLPLSRSRVSRPQCGVDRGGRQHELSHQLPENYGTLPNKRNCFDMSTVINKFEHKVAHQDSDIKELQRKVRSLEKAMVKSEKKHNITKKTLLKVRRQLKDILMTRLKIKSEVDADPSLFSSKDCKDGVKCEMVSIKQDVNDDVTYLDCSTLDMDCIVEEAENEAGLGQSSSSQLSPTTTKCPQMLTPVSHNNISTKQLIESLSSQDSGSNSCSQCKNEATISSITGMKSPTAMPLKPLKSGVKVLQSYKVEKSSLFTVSQVLQMYDGQSIATMAGKLAEMAVYGPNVLKKCTPMGVGKKGFPALPQDELYFIKQTILNYTPSVWNDLTFFEEVWNKHCIKSIGHTCAQKRSQHCKV